MDSNNSEEDRVQRSMLRGVKWLYGGFTVLSIAIIARIFIIQIGGSSEELITLGEKISYRPQPVMALRGNLLADDGRILATSIPTYELRIDLAMPGIVDSVFQADVAMMSRQLSEFFGDRSAAEYEQKFREERLKGSRYVRLAPRKVNFLELNEIKEFAFLNQGRRRSGLIINEEYQRKHPLGGVADRVLGFVNSVGRKVGLEGAFDDDLRGMDGLSIEQKISGDFWIPVESRLNLSPVDGLDVKTTINVSFQRMAQDALRQRLIEVDAKWGTVVVMEVETGHIKAMANLTQKTNGEIVEDYNYAVGTAQEPGSTFKLPVLLALLDDTGAKLTDRYDTKGGEMYFGERRVRDSHRGGYGELSLQGVFDKSSNIGMAMAVNKAYEGRESHFVDRLLSYGVGDPLGIVIPGEAPPLVKHPKNRKSGWDGTSMTMMSYGYALLMTPLQTLTFYNAVANGGKMVRPLFVSELQRNGQVVEEFPVEVLNEQIASPSAIKQVQLALESVVNNGTAKTLKSDYFSSAAKTGTAQIAQGSRGYGDDDSKRQYLGSVAGYFPADNPKYSMIIAFETHYQSGSGRTYYGAQLAAPIFKSISEFIYNSSYEFITPYSGNDNFMP
ncbi:MAG: penicillin-binding protein 2 [Rikenellaceae bacterium]